VFDATSCNRKSSKAYVLAGDNVDLRYFNRPWPQRRSSTVSILHGPVCKGK
jgi:hypothetical protein